MVETAVSLILAFSLAFLLFEASMLAYTYSVMNNAAREGVRYAMEEMSQWKFTGIRLNPN